MLTPKGLPVILRLAIPLLVLSGCGHGQGSMALLNLEAIKAQERVIDKKLELLSSMGGLMSTLPSERGAIAEIETDETGRSHIKVYPQDTFSKRVELLHQIIEGQNSTMSGMEIKLPEMQEDIGKEVLDKGYKLARLGIGGLLLREIMGLFINGPYWRWEGME